LIYSVDKIENNVAALVGDGGDMVYIDISSLGFDIKQHDILLYDEDTAVFRPDKSGSDGIRYKREEENKKRLKKLFDR